ncbi:MAG: hypothetical protein QXI58_00390 [Candidatus Micrarchaeia archaeon]|jgi:hypothetical protein
MVTEGEQAIAKFDYDLYYKLTELLQVPPILAKAFVKSREQIIKKYQDKILDLFSNQETCILLEYKDKLSIILISHIHNMNFIYLPLVSTMHALAARNSVLDNYIETILYREKIIIDFGNNLNIYIKSEIMGLLSLALNKAEKIILAFNDDIKKLRQYLNLENSIGLLPDKIVTLK